ncbi:MAG TPA: DUF4388 domain-containing protein [Thermoanaerobaculia bacterium]|nr:DUF4388 domain-containing protein [Thermoanaerobaculia bacterium]
MDTYPDELQGALYDIQRYLQDEIPPLNASDAVATLIGQPPQLLMQEVRVWAVGQSRLQSASMSDLLFHALRKVHLVGALKLIDRNAADAYLAAVIPLALEACPPDERELLKTNLITLRSSRDIGGAASSSQAVPISRSNAGGTAGGAVARPADPVVRHARRLSMVIDRLSDRAVVPPSPQQTAFNDTPAQLVTMAAQSSTSEEELEEYIRTLQPYTGESDPDKLFKVLADGVPKWEIALPSRPSASIEAMHRIITLTPSMIGAAKRFRELMAEAIAQFNGGSLPAAVAMLELADIVIAEKKLDATVVDRVRSDCVESISSEQMRRYAENKTKHALLRKALGFFPTLTRQSLLQELRGEARPERRRAILGLLEAYGHAGRDAALADLDIELARDPADLDTYYLRNLIYLLHRIPRETDDGIDKELELLTRSTARGHNIYVIKEAIIPLGHIKTDAAVKLLVTRLAEFEALLVRKDALYAADEMQKTVDRIVAALARIATPAALLAIARHGMKPNPLLGDTRGRLASLAQHDLSFDEDTVNVLAKTIREDLPAKVFGKVIATRPAPLRLIEALSSTRSEVVEKLFAEIVEKFGEYDTGRMAAAALANLASLAKGKGRDTQAATLTGDLEFFALPSLMQSLAETQATGIVTLSTKQGQTSGKLLFLNGKFVDAQTGHLRGVDAIYQMLERPVPGMFAFVPQPTLSVKTKTDPVDIMGLLFEGIRRHDELRQACILVPDDLALAAGTVKPTPDPEETDPSIIREVWVKASGGTKISDWETQIATDAYRIRRLVMRWLEEGALQPVVMA